MSVGASIALILIGAAGTGGPPPSHPSEIKLFASTMAIAKTVREACAGTAIDEDYLEALRQRLHVVDADLPVYAADARSAANVLQHGLAEAPSRRAWCDAVFRLYGPEGRMIRGLLRR